MMKRTGRIALLSITAIALLVSAGPAWGSDRNASAVVTPFSMDFYGYIGSARIGDSMTVFDPDGVLCGQQTITRDGQYGFLHVYGDDPATLPDEGARGGDPLTFKLNGETLVPVSQTSIRWMGDRERRQVDFTKP